MDGLRAKGLVLTALGVAVSCTVASRLPQVDPALYEECSDPAAQAALNAANSMLAGGRNLEAVPLLREVVAICPDHVPTHKLYQDICLELGGEPLEEMEAYYREFPGDPPSSVMQYMRARLLEADLDWDDDRLIALDELLELDPGFYYAHFSKARLLRSVGQLGRSIQSFRDALEVNGSLLEAHLELAEVLVELRRFREAEPHYANYVRGQPTDWAARREYVRLLLYDLDEVAEAQQHLAALLRVDPDDPALVMDRAALAWRSGRLEEAETLYREVLERDPTKSRALLNLGNLYFESMARTDVEKRRYWPMARRAYLDYLQLARIEGAMDLFDYHLAIPFRLKQINSFLGG